MNFINDIKSSLYNPRFYASLRERSLASSFKYFFSLVAILVFVIAFAWGSELSPLFSRENLMKLVAYYPAELSIAIKAGVISTNVTEPYIIKTGEEFSKMKNGHPNMVVIDTTSVFSRELFKQYDTSVWVGKDFVASSKNQDQLELSDVSRAPDFSLNRSRLLHWVDIINHYHLLLSLGLFAALFFSFYGFFTFQLLWLFLMAFLVLLVAKLYKHRLSYKNSYQIALHAATVPFILTALSIVSGIRVPFPFFYTLLALLIVLVNLKKTAQISS